MKRIETTATISPNGTVAALQATSMFVGGRPEVKSPDVLEVTERFENWLGRQARIQH